MSPPRPSRRRRGFTIIELISTIVILGAIGSVASTVILSATSGYLDARIQAQLHTEVSIGLDRLAREIRAIPRLSTGGPDISTISSSGMTWAGGHDLSFTTGPTGGVYLKDGPTSTSTRLIADQTAFTFEWQDQNGTAIPGTGPGDIANIRRISVEVTVERFGMSETLKMLVYLRALMEGSDG